MTVLKDWFLISLVLVWGTAKMNEVHDLVTLVAVVFWTTFFREKWKKFKDEVRGFGVRGSELWGCRVWSLRFENLDRQSLGLGNQTRNHMPSIKHFTELVVWKEARILVKISYRIMSDPASLKNDYSLRDQFRRAVLSSMNNIAEGFGRASNKDFAHFVNIAAASLDEAESMTYVLEDLSSISNNQLLELRNQIILVKKLCVGLRRYLLRSQKPTSKRS